MAPSPCSSSPCSVVQAGQSIVSILHRALRIAAALLFLALTVVQGGEKATQASPEEEFLLKADQRLDKVYLLGGDGLAAHLERALFDPKPLQDKAERLMKKGPKSLRPGAAALLSKIHRLANADSPTSLKIVAPFLIDREAVKAWRTSFEEEREKAIERWKEECRQARKERVAQPPKPEKQLFAPFPAPTTWTISSENCRCAIEAGLSLLHLGQRQDALLVFKTIGQKFSDDMAEILAAEGAGLAFMAPSLYEKSVEWFKRGIKLCRRCVKYLGMEDASGEIKHLRHRLEHRLAQASRLRDIEAFGEAYCAYRQCQNLRWEAKHLPAYLAYEDLAKDFPRTVFSEASGAYRVKCLLKLVEPAHEAQAREVIAKAEAQYLENEKALEEAEKSKALHKNMRKILKAQLEEQLETLNRMKRVALGKKSVRAAERLAARLAKDEFNLYRGEMLVDLANHSFEKELRPSKAEKRFMRAWKWLSEVEGVDAALAEFAVPDKAKEISRPPQKEAKIDRMGNIDNEKIEPGMIFNRKTCPFYLNDLMEQCSLAIGFLHFYKGNNKTAIEWYAKVPELDQKTSLLQRRGEWSNFARLKWGVEHGFLNAFPEELKIFKKRMRFVVLMADFYFCTQRFAKAKELAQRLLAGEFGELEAKQDDYPQYLMASCEYWERDRKTAYLECSKLLDEKEWTITQHRAAFTAANLSWYILDKEIVSQGLDMLRKLADSKKKSPYVYRARLVLGLRLMKLGDLKGGLRMLKRIPEKASGYHAIAEEYLKAYEELKAAAKKKRKEG